MIGADRDALVCDLAETYGVLDWRALPVRSLATLASGLGEHSRIKRKISGSRATTTEVLLAAAVDKLSTLIWFQTEDGHAGRNRPPSVLGLLLGEPQEEPDGAEGFDSGDEYEKMWERATGVSHGK